MEFLTSYGCEFFRESKKHSGELIKRIIYSRGFGEIKIYKKRSNISMVVSTANSRARCSNLPFTLTVAQWKNMLFGNFEEEIFSYTEYLENNIILGHFIPLSWGHGGTYEGNVFPITEDENKSCRNLNPILMYPESVIDDFAKRNGLTLEQYKAFVNWCYNNRRTYKEVKQYIGTYNSIEEWKKNYN